MPQPKSPGTKRHFLIVAASSRCARFFALKALSQGHSVTALCRAADDAAALERMKAILREAIGEGEEPDFSGLKAAARSILTPETYQSLLDEDLSIDAIACFVGPSKISEMLNPFNSIYTDTITAILSGMQRSRPVEVLYHSSVGVGGAPRDAYNYWPANFPALSSLVHILLPVFQNVRDSERLFEGPGFGHNDYIVFRPSTLKDEPAVGGTMSLTNLSRETPHKSALASAETIINREDVAEEMLRVALLDPAERSILYGSSLYLTRKA
ncbi:MAG: hypothetical protein AAGH53_05565 [Pseudomonadota bacterium]